MRKRIILLLALLILIPALPIWYWYSTQIRLQSSFKAITSYTAVSHDGFVIRDSPDILTFRDWSGRLQWNVRLPERNLSGWQLPENDELKYLDADEGCVFSISYHNNLLVAATAQGEFINLQIWQQGALISEHNLPRPPKPVSAGEQQMVNVQAMTDGRVLLWAAQNPQYPIYIFNGNQRLATNAPAAIKSFNSQNWRYYFFTRDGNSLVAYNNDYATFVYRISWQRKLMHIKLIASAPAPGDLYGKDTLLTAYGSSYRGGEKIADINGWLMAQPPLDGWFTVQIKPASPGDYVGDIRAYNPLNNNEWIIRDKADAQSGTITADGKFAAVMYQANSTKTAITVLERPGRFRARGFLPVQRKAEYKFFASKMHLSPDGHSLLITPEYDGDYFLLYHWK